MFGFYLSNFPLKFLSSDDSLSPVLSLSYTIHTFISVYNEKCYVIVFHFPIPFVPATCFTHYTNLSCCKLPSFMPTTQDLFVLISFHYPASHTSQYHQTKYLTVEFYVNALFLLVVCSPFSNRYGVVASFIVFMLCDESSHEKYKSN